MRGSKISLGARCLSQFRIVAKKVYCNRSFSMKIEVTKEQIYTLLDGLDALIENAEYEDRATTDEDILESNEKSRRAAQEVYNYLAAQIN